MRYESGIVRLISQDDAWDDDDDDFGGSDVGEFDYLSCEYLLPDAPGPSRRSAQHTRMHNSCEANEAQLGSTLADPITTPKTMMKI